MKRRTVESPQRPPRGWLLCLLVSILLVAATTLAVSAAALVTAKFIRLDGLPHCFTVFASGPDVVPGPGEADPFHPELGPMAKGRVEVGDECLRWEIVCFNLSSPVTSMALHGPLHRGMETAPPLVDMNIGDVGKDGHFLRSKCLPITYEQELAINSRPGDFYLQLNSEAFPDGAVRGPLGTRCGGSL